jgi:hypothetical protein
VQRTFHFLWSLRVRTHGEGPDQVILITQNSGQRHSVRSDTRSRDDQPSGAAFMSTRTCLTNILLHVFLVQRSVYDPDVNTALQPKNFCSCETRLIFLQSHDTLLLMVDKIYRLYFPVFWVISVAEYFQCSRAIPPCHCNQNLKLLKFHRAFVVEGLTACHSTNIIQNQCAEFRFGSNWQSSCLKCSLAACNEGQ